MGHQHCGVQFLTCLLQHVKDKGFSVQIFESGLSFDFRFKKNQVVNYSVKSVSFTCHLVNLVHWEEMNVVSREWLQQCSAIERHNRQSEQYNFSN